MKQIQCLVKNFKSLSLSLSLLSPIQIKIKFRFFLEKKLFQKKLEMQAEEEEEGLVWDHLRTRLVPQEIDEVRRIIGSHLIEENEILNREWIR